MSRSQEKIFSTLGPKLRGSKALQDYGDKLLQIRIETIDYAWILKVMHSCQTLNFRLKNNLFSQESQLCRVSHLYVSS